MYLFSEAKTQVEAFTDRAPSENMCSSEILTNWKYGQIHSYVDYIAAHSIIHFISIHALGCNLLPKIL